MHGFPLSMLALMPFPIIRARLRWPAIAYCLRFAFANDVDMESEPTGNSGSERAACRELRATGFTDFHLLPPPPAVPLPPGARDVAGARLGKKRREVAEPDQRHLVAAHERTSARGARSPRTSGCARRQPEPARHQLG